MIKPELSKKNECWLEKHRYYELKHFALQYPTWRRLRNALDGLSRRPIEIYVYSYTGEHGDPTAACAAARERFTARMKLVEDAVRDAAPDLYPYLLVGVTENVTYDILKARSNIPCSRVSYYEAYRRFFWYLNSSRN